MLVDHVLHEKLSINLIEEGIERVLEMHQSIASPSLEDIREVDRWARVEGTRIVAQLQ